MPFVALETSTEDNKNLKRHILSFVDHTLPMFRMSVTNKKANTLIKEMCDTMPKEFHDTVHAKRIWINNQDETLKLYMSSPNFLRKVSLHVEPADRDQFICKSISELTLEIMDAFSNARQPLGSWYTNYHGSVQKIVTAAVRFGTRPHELAKQPIECHLDSIEKKLRALSHGNTAEDFKNLSDIKIEALSMGLSRNLILGIEDKELSQQLSFWGSNIETYALILIGMQAKEPKASSPRI